MLELMFSENCVNNKNREKNVPQVKILDKKNFFQFYR